MPEQYLCHSNDLHGFRRLGDFDPRLHARAGLRDPQSIADPQPVAAALRQPRRDQLRIGETIGGQLISAAAAVPDGGGPQHFAGPVAAARDLQERHAMGEIYHPPSNPSDNQSKLARRATTGLLATGLIPSLLFTLTSRAAHSQVILNEMPVTFTVEGYGNATTGATREAASVRGQAPDAVLFDGAARVLARLSTVNGPDIGARVVVEGSTYHVHLIEASVLLFGSAGRLEVGKRMGLPDVLTGYAPNSFAFTKAEFGPPTGRSLDPGGGLQTQFF